jgi:hypothetical protein
MPKTMLEHFKSARRVSTPLVAITTADPEALVQEIRTSFNGTCPPLLRWSTVRGVYPANEAGEAALLATLQQFPDPASGQAMDPTALVNPAQAIWESVLLALPEDCILFAETLDACVTEQGTAGVMAQQAVRDLRDPFKRDGKMLVFLSPGFNLPALLKDDVLRITQPLPTREQLAQVVRGVYQYAEVDAPEDAVVEKAVDALAGLAHFPSDQATAMCLERTEERKGVLDLEGLWERKRLMIGNTPGLSVRDDRETFESVGGVEGAKRFLRLLIEGKRRPNCLLFIDEIEKAMAGAMGDTSGVSADYLGQLLSWMQDTEALGLFFVGPAGTCKSALAKAAGREAGVPTVAFDLGGMKGQYVGQSEQRLRQALQVVDAVGQGKVLVIATSNNIASLPPELRRRFMATFFFDLPTPEERDLIWRIYEEKYQTTGERPDDTDWTGAEIKQCCSLSDTLGVTKAEAANYLVPVAKSSFESIQRLRDMADGTFIAASAHGVYQKPKAASAAPKAGTRKLRAAE